MPFPPDVKAEALIACGRRCCICHRFCGVRVECHHIVPEGEGGPNTVENCIPLCFNCHSDVGHYNPQHPRGNKFTPSELKGHRDNWHRLLREAIIEGLAKGVMNPQAGNTASETREIDLSENEVAILALLADGEKPADEIARTTGINKVRVDYHLAEMDDKDLVMFRAKIYGGGAWWFVQGGRRFLVENNLID